jgi:hypothetical protein
MRCRSRFVRLLLVPLSAAAIALSVAGCGDHAARRIPARAVPLAPGLRIAASFEACDRGRHAFCARNLVIVGPSSISAHRLKSDERLALLGAGWRKQAADVAIESAASSPDGSVFAAYATGPDELLAANSGQIDRPRDLLRALVRQIALGRPSLLIVLSAGA